MTLVLPSPELRIHIWKELNENVDTREDDLKHMKEWLLKQPHLPNTWDEQCLLSFLRGSNFSLEKCKRKLDMYFTMRTALPEFFTNRDVNRPELRCLTSLGQGCPLPGLTPQGRRVTIIRGLDKNIETPNMADIMKISLMVGDIRLQIEKYGVSGDVYILDASVLTASHFAKAANPILFKKFLICVQEAYPVKVKEVHVVNAIPLVDIVVNWVKPFVKEKLRNRVHIHSKLDTLYDFVPKDILPEEYGGTAGKMADFCRDFAVMIVPHLELHEGSYYKYINKYSVDELFRYLLLVQASNELIMQNMKTGNLAKIRYPETSNNKKTLVVSNCTDDWISKLEEFEPWFKAQENIKADESRRPGKPTNQNDLFGLDGSFRQLSID